MGKPWLSGDRIVEKMIFSIRAYEPFGGGEGIQRSGEEIQREGVEKGVKKRKEGGKEERKEEKGREKEKKRRGKGNKSGCGTPTTVYQPTKSTITLA